MFVMIGVILFIVSFSTALTALIMFVREGTTHVTGFEDEFERMLEPIKANYKHGWMVKTKAGDTAKIVAILTYQFEDVGEPYYFVQSKKTGISYHLKESEIVPKEVK